MSRCIQIDAKGPVEIPANQESRWICACGLSKNKPFCDGSHHGIKNEEEEKMYHYDAKGECKECTGTCCK